ncbi:P-loop NTPase [Okibacterium endophyticum]
MVTIVTALGRASEEHLLPELINRGHRIVGRVGEGEDTIDVALSVRPAALLIDSSPQRLTRDVLSTCDDLGIRTIAVAETERGRRNAAALGLYEVYDSHAPVAALHSMIDEGAPTWPDEAKAGRVFTVWGPHGAPGRTTVAVNLAAELAAAGHRVALVDADTHAASVAPMLGMLDEAPGFAAACRLAGQNALSLTELDRIHQPYAVGRGELRVLTGITRAARWPELGAERVSSTLTLCRQWAAFVVVDVAASLDHDEEISTDLFAPRRNAATLAALRAADRVIAVGSADPVGLSRYLRAHAELIEVVPEVPVTTMINKVRATIAGLNPSGQVALTLSRFGGIDDPVIVPHDLRGTDAALAAGRVVRDVAPRSHALAALRRFATAEILPAVAQPVQRRARRRRGVTAATAS